LITLYYYPFKEAFVNFAHFHFHAPKFDPDFCISAVFRCRYQYLMKLSRHTIGQWYSEAKYFILNTIFAVSRSSFFLLLCKLTFRSGVFGFLQFFRQKFEMFIILEPMITCTSCSFQQARRDPLFDDRRGSNFGEEY
jgi:hypothetical protein